MIRSKSHAPKLWRAHFIYCANCYQLLADDQLLPATVTFTSNPLRARILYQMAFLHIFPHQSVVLMGENLDILEKGFFWGEGWKFMFKLRVRNFV